VRNTAWVVLLLLVARPASAGEVVEPWDDGTPRLRYVVDEQGVRVGPFTEYDREGRVLVRGTYRKDQLDGLWTALRPDGSPREKGVYRAGKKDGKWEAWGEDRALTLVEHWKDGRRHGQRDVFRGKERIAEQVWAEGVLVTLDGAPAFPKARAAVEAKVAEWIGPPAPPRRKVPDLAEDRTRAWRRLCAYRYVCDVPHDIVLGDDLNDLAQAASRISLAHGDISHTPANPGWSAQEFEVAARGCLGSNLGMDPSADASVDGYFDDSDEENVDAVGHRCWCLNPAMLRTGFGFVRSPDGQGFTAMWSTDESRTPVPPVDAVPYPARGWMPLDLFGDRHAWSVSLSKARWKGLDPSKVTMEIQPLDADFVPAGEPLPLENVKFAEGAPGLGWLAIFRPKSVTLTDGAAFRVTVGPLGPAAKKKPAPVFRCVVAFFQRGEAPKPG
jgi:hypothetical protein